MVLYNHRHGTGCGLRRARTLGLDLWCAPKDAPSWAACRPPPQAWPTCRGRRRIALKSKAWWSKRQSKKRGGPCLKLLIEMYTLKRAQLLRVYLVTFHQVNLLMQPTPDKEGECYQPIQSPFPPTSIPVLTPRLSQPGFELYMSRITWTGF
jgi:hypothetical protein